MDFSIAWLVLAVKRREGGIINQTDVKSVFLNVNFEKEDSVYPDPPEGLDFGVKHGESLKM